MFNKSRVRQRPKVCVNRLSFSGRVFIYICIHKCVCAHIHTYTFNLPDNLLIHEIFFYSLLFLYNRVKVVSDFFYNFSINYFGKIKTLPHGNNYLTIYKIRHYLYPARNNNGWRKIIIIQ